MKKLLTLWILTTTLILAWCNSSNKNNSGLTQQNKQEIQNLTNNDKALINVQEKTKQVEQTLKKIWLTWEKLKQEMIRQKAWLEIIAHLKWDARKKYILENKVLPKIIKSWKVSKKCTTTNLWNYVACLYVTKTPIEKLLKQIPQTLQNEVKKEYYSKFYNLNRWNLFKASSDPIALQAKKNKIQQLFNDGALTNPVVCSRFPDQEVKNYCKSLFEQK